jgi:hypothetical protein
MSGREHIGKGVPRPTPGAGIMTDKAHVTTRRRENHSFQKHSKYLKGGLPHVCTWIASRCVTEIPSVSCHAAPDGGAVNVPATRSAIVASRSVPCSWTPTRYSTLKFGALSLIKCKLLKADGKSYYPCGLPIASSRAQSLRLSQNDSSGTRPLSRGEGGYFVHLRSSREFIGGHMAVVISSLGLAEEREQPHKDVRKRADGRFHFFRRYHTYHRQGCLVLFREPHGVWSFANISIPGSLRFPASWARQ